MNGVTPSAATACRLRKPSPEHPGQRDRPEAAADLPQELAPGAAAELSFVPGPSASAGSRALFMGWFASDHGDTAYGGFHTQKYQ